MIEAVVFTDDMIKEMFNKTPSYYEKINSSLNPDNIK